MKTAEEVLEYTGAFLQLYREEGWYLERTVHYVGRVGLDYVKEKVLDDADEPQGAVRAPASSRSTASPIRGSSATRPRSTRGSSSRSSRLSPRRKP